MKFVLLLATLLLAAAESKVTCREAASTSVPEDKAACEAVSSPESDDDQSKAAFKDACLAVKLAENAAVSACVYNEEEVDGTVVPDEVSLLSLIFGKIYWAIGTLLWLVGVVLGLVALSVVTWAIFNSDWRLGIKDNFLSLTLKVFKIMDFAKIEAHDVEAIGNYRAKALQVHRAVWPRISKNWDAKQIELLVPTSCFNVTGSAFVHMHEKIQGCLLTPKGWNENTSKNKKLVVWYHGGGWVTGDMHNIDLKAFLKNFEKRDDVAIVSVNFRQAPESAFPVPFNDCLGSYLYLRQHAEKFGWNPNEITVAGLSSGANLAATVAVEAHSLGKPCKYQVLVAPMISPLLNTRSYRENKNNLSMPGECMRWYWKLYIRGLGHATRLDKDPRINPGADPSKLKGLAPACVVTGKFDICRDEGITYVEQLKEAGVRTDHLMFKSTHSFMLSRTDSSMQKKFIGIVNREV